MKRKGLFAKALAVIIMLNLIPQSIVPAYAEMMADDVAMVSEAGGDGTNVSTEAFSPGGTDTTIETTVEPATVETNEAVVTNTEQVTPTDNIGVAQASPSVAVTDTQQGVVAAPANGMDTAVPNQNEGTDRSLDAGLTAEGAASVTKIEDEATQTENQEAVTPAYSYTYTAPDGIVAIKIDAPEGAFPEGVQVNIEKVASEKIVDAIKNASAVEDLSAADVIAYDFDFYKDDEHHIEPKKEISVTFQNVAIGEDKTVSAFHLENEAAQAEAVTVTNVDDATGAVQVQAADFSIYAIVSTPAATTDGKIWIDNDTSTTYNTINDAVNAASNGATIHIQGKFGENGTAVTGAEITKNITLDIAGDTTMVGNNNIDGITLASGSKLRASNGSTLTMSEFRTALTVASGAEINDGTYIFTNNKSTTRGINIQGSVKGSTGRDSVIIKANDKAETNFYSGNATFENATIEVTSQTWTWKDASPLNLRNVSMILSGFGQGYYVQGGSIIDSFLEMKDPGLRWGFIRYGSTGIAFQGNGAVISGSTIQLDYGSNAGLSIGLSNAATAMTIENSTLDFRNGGTGGFNVNTGDITLSNTTIKGDGGNNGALYGAQNNGKITITNNSLVETPGTRNADNGLGQRPDNYVVVGGSFLIKHAEDYQSGAAIPTNGTANGNEKLDYVTLADPSLTQVTVLNSLGNTYTYTVANASSDGKKHIFAPTNKVVFDVNSATGAFADGTNTTKSRKTVRGNTLDLLEGNGIPADPTNTNTGLTFVGWYYTDASGAEQPFTLGTLVTADMTVKAKWNTQQTITHTGTLEGDLLIGGDTEHTAVKDVNAGDVLEFTSRFNLRPFKDQIQTTSTQLGGAPNAIPTENIQSKFKTVLIFPSGLTLPNTVTATLTNNDLFEITNTEKTGNQVTVTMALKKNYANFADLLTDVTALPDSLEIAVPNVSVSNTVADMAQLTTKGTVTGTFSGKVTTATGDRQLYDMQWTAVQTPNGKDAIQDASDDTTIQYTIKVANRTVLASEETIYGDLLIGEDTGHDHGYRVYPEDVLTFTGRLYISPIKDKINALRARYTGDITQITTEDIASQFVATLNVGNGLTIDDNVTATLTDNDVFKIDSTVKNGNIVTVTMSLKKNYANFDALYNDVNAVPDILNMNIGGVIVDASVTPGRFYNVVGTVDGTFTGKATAPSGKSELYNFKWKAIQLPEGISFIHNIDDEVSIEYPVYTVERPTVISSNENLYGDILIGEDTEHTALHDVNVGDSFTYTGRLYIAPIKDKINGLKATYSGDGSQIVTADIKSSFTTTLTVPNGLTLPNSVTATLTDNDLFKIDSVVKNGNDVKIIMSLKKNYGNFADLFNDVIAVPDSLNVDIPGITVENTNAHGTQLTAKGTVTGAFTGKATSPLGKVQLYDFKWTGIQIPDGKDFIQPASDNDTIQYTVKVLNQTVLNATETLYGDILIDEDTEHTALHDVNIGDVLTYTGRLYVAPIKDKINALKARYTGDTSQIVTENISSTFTTSLIIPTGLIMPDTATATLTNNDLFKITSVVKYGNSIRVTMDLKKNYTNFSDLYNDVMSVPDTLDVEIPNITVSGSNVDATRLTVKGSVDGTFLGRATAPSGRSEVYGFRWVAEQLPAGKDFIQPATDNRSIQYTVKVNKPTTLRTEENLYGDILIGNETEHFTVYPVTAGSTHAYTGRLFVEPIKQKITALNAQYGGNPEQVLTENIASTFTTKLAIPSGLIMPNTVTANLTANPLFQVSNVTKSGQNIIVTMTLKKNYTNFADLFNDVIAVPDSLDLTIPNLQVDPTTAVGTRLTVVGTVNGVFTGKAVSPSGSTQIYDFKWQAVQTDDGRDYIQSSTDHDTIQFTVEVLPKIPLDPNDTTGGIEMIKIHVHKTWVGNTGNEAIVEIYRDSELIRTATLTSANNWRQVFEFLPKFDFAGNVITYQVKERDIYGYRSEIKRNDDGSYEIINTWKAGDNGGGTPGGNNNNGGGTPGGNNNNGGGTPGGNNNNGGGTPGGNDNNGGGTPGDNNNNGGKPVPGNGDTKPVPGNNNGDKPVPGNGNTKPVPGNTTPSTPTTVEKTPGVSIGKDVPKTGDESNMGIWLSVMALSMSLIGVNIILMRRRKKHD